MSCIVKQKRKAANGETIYYAYESTSVWIPGVGPRSKRRFLGRMDPLTGEILPTEKRGRKKKETQPVASDIPGDASTNSDTDKDKQALIASVNHLEKQLVELKGENDHLRKQTQILQAKLSRTERGLQAMRASVNRSLDTCISDCQIDVDQ